MWSYTLLRSEEDMAGPIVRSALESLLDEREQHSQDDVTLIGPRSTESVVKMTSDDGLDASDLSKITDESLLLYRCTADDDEWDFGIIGEHIISYGPCVMVQTSALSILLHATFGRMDGRRFWRLMMATIRTVNSGEYVIPGINYGDVLHDKDVWQQDLENTPGMTEDEVKELESLNDEDKVKQAVLFEGLMWIWMSPDR